MVYVAPVQAQMDNMFYWFGDTERLRQKEFEYDFGYMPDQDVEGQTDEFGMIEHEARFAMPVWSENEGQRLGIFADMLYQDIDTSAVLPQSGMPFPDDLYDPQFGVDYVERLENGWVWGGMLGVSSPSDEPYNSFDEMEIELNSFVRIPHVDDNAWLVMLNFSTNREFLNFVPLPGFAYWYQPNDRFVATLGIPLAFQYRPLEPLTLRASYIPLRNVFTEAAYDVTEQVQLFSGFEWSNERFLLADRRDDDDRLFYYEKRAQGGVRFSPRENISIELTGGFAFDREYFLGEDYDDRDDDGFDVADSPFVDVSVNVRW